MAAQGKGSGRRALVIGGRGNMGHWFADFLASQGYAVEIVDPAGPAEGYPHRADWHESPLQHDVIVVATPLGTTAGVLHELAGRRPRGLVFDLGSSGQKNTKRGGEPLWTWQEKFKIFCGW